MSLSYIQRDGKRQTKTILELSSREVEQMQHDYELTNQELEELSSVNTRLKNLQDKILLEAIKIDNEIRQRVAEGSDTLYDYELELKIFFDLKEDDSEYNEDNDNILTEISEYLKGISKTPLEEQWFWSGNHNEHREWESHMKHDYYHCWWYHCLYDHNRLSWKDILRIGNIFTQIEVHHQYIDENY